MHQLLRWDMKQIKSAINEVQKDLEILESDHVRLPMEREQSVLKELIEHVDRLDLDLSIALSDCVSLGRQYWKDHNLAVIADLHWSLSFLGSVSEDLKRVEVALNGAYINPSDIRQLGRNWDRLKKSISRVQRSMRHFQQRRKRHAWTPRNSRKAEGVS